MAPKLSVVYFDMGGAAEPIRWALEVSGVEWTDKRLTREEFATLKPSLPNGQVPVLEVDGSYLPQSMAILRYVGKIGGLYPVGDDLQAAKCDAIMDCAFDYYVNVRPSIVEKDEAKKMQMREDLAANFFPTWLNNLEKQLDQTPGMYFGDKLSVADIIIVYRLRTLKSGILDGIQPTIVDSCPKLSALYSSIMGEPKIAAFVAKHAK